MAKKAINKFPKMEVMLVKKSEKNATSSMLINLLVKRLLNSCESAKCPVFITNPSTFSRGFSNFKYKSSTLMVDNALASFIISGIKNRKNKTIINQMVTKAIAALKPAGNARFLIRIFFSKRKIGCPNMDMAAEINIYATIERKYQNPKMSKAIPIKPIIYRSLLSIIVDLLWSKGKPCEAIQQRNIYQKLDNDQTNTLYCGYTRYTVVYG